MRQLFAAMLLLSACTERVLVTLPFPSVETAQTELIAVGNEVLVHPVGDLLTLSAPLPDQPRVTIAATLYRAALTDLGLHAGPASPAGPGFPIDGDRYTLDVVDGTPGLWVAGDDPRLDRFGLRYRMTSLGRGSGEGHTCFVGADRGLYCMGTDEVLALSPYGVGSRRPRRMPGLEEVDQVIAGLRFTCFIQRGAVWCFGQNGDRQLGDPFVVRSRDPLQVAGITDAVELDSGGNHTCARDRDGAVTCWGPLAGGPVSQGPVRRLVGHRIDLLAAGTDGVCGIEAGEVWCQGVHRDDIPYPGALCDTGTPHVFDEAPVQLELPGVQRPIRDVTLGSRSGCAIGGEGDVHCWGCNIYGQLGDGSYFVQGTAIEVGPRRLELPPMIAIEQGNTSGCGISADHRAVCWGKNDQGQLGHDVDNADLPRAILEDGLEITNAVEITVYWDHACMRLETEEIRCFGRRDCGQLGAGPFDGDKPAATCDQGEMIARGRQTTPVTLAF